MFDPYRFNCQVAHQNCVYACPTPIQEAVARSFEKEMDRLDSPEWYFKTICEYLQRKIDSIAGICRDVGMEPVVPEGGYFIMADWSKLADKIDLSRLVVCKMEFFLKIFLS